MCRLGLVDAFQDNLISLAKIETTFCAYNKIILIGLSTIHCRMF